MKRSQSPQPEPRVSTASVLVAAAVSLVLVAAADSGVAAAGFNDAPDYVTVNPHVRAGLTAAGVRWAMTAMARVRD